MIWNVDFLDVEIEVLENDDDVEKKIFELKLLTGLIFLGPQDRAKI